MYKDNHFMIAEHAVAMISVSLYDIKYSVCTPTGLKEMVYI